EPSRVGLRRRVGVDGHSQLQPLAQGQLPGDVASPPAETDDSTPDHAPAPRNAITAVVKSWLASIGVRCPAPSSSTNADPATRFAMSAITAGGAAGSLLPTTSRVGTPIEPRRSM